MLLLNISCHWQGERLNTNTIDLDFYFIFFKYFFGLIDRTAEDMTGNRERDGEWHAAKGPGRELNPGPLQSLGAKRSPALGYF